MLWRCSYRTPGEPEFIATANGADLLNENYKTLTVGIMDGAGLTGSGMVSSMGLMTNMSFDSNDQQKQQKVVEVAGIKAQQTYYRQRKKVEIQFVYEGSFLISINANQLDPEQTWAIIALLDLEGLIRKAN